MNEVALALETHLDINPETGEVEGEERLLITEDLPLIARQMRALYSKIEMIKLFRDKEAERIMSVCTEKMVRLEKQVTYFESLAEQLVREIPDRKVDYPGLGRFRFRKMPDKVDVSDYDAMSDDEKLSVRNRHQGCFRVKTTVTPDKRKIKGLLDDIAAGKSDAQIEGFQVQVGGEKFEFKPE